LSANHRAINGQGDVAGTDTKTNQSMLWPRALPPIEIDAPAGGWAPVAVGVNNGQTVTGYYYIDGSVSCFMWTIEQGSVDMGWSGHGRIGDRLGPGRRTRQRSDMLAA